MPLRNVAVIPALNEQNRIGAILYSLADQDLDGIIVVDNGSEDDTAGVVENSRASLPHANIRLITEATRGIGHACITGFRHAIDELGADIVSRLDSDTVALPYWGATTLPNIAASNWLAAQKSP